MQPIPEVGQKIEVTHQTYISFIKDIANSILPYRAHPLSSSGMAHYNRPSILVNLVNRSSVIMDIDTSSYRIKPSSTIGGEGFMSTSLPTSASTLAPVEATTLPPLPIATGFVSVPHEFLQ